MNYQDVIPYDFVTLLALADYKHDQVKVLIQALIKTKRCPSAFLVYYQLFCKHDLDGLRDALVVDCEKKECYAITFLVQLVLNKVLDKNVLQSIEGKELLAHFAAAGYAPAQFLQGFMHEKGLFDVRTDASQAFLYYQHAADQEFAMAQFLLAESYRKGNLGLTVSYAKSFDYLRRAAQQGLSRAQYFLALIYCGDIKEFEVPVNESLAHDYLKKASDQACLEAQVYMAKCYEGGTLGFKKDDRLAVKYYKLAAQRNYPEAQVAQVRLASAYENGNLGFQVDFKKAVEYYHLAADQTPGDANAQFALGLAYESGRLEGQEESQQRQKALRYYNKAAHQGHILAQNNLAVLYYQLAKENPSPEEATRLKRVAQRLQQYASRHNNAGSTCNLAITWLEWADESKDEKYTDECRENALTLFRHAAEQGSGRAEYHLATILAKGVFVERNMEKAQKHFMKAIEKGFPVAQWNQAVSNMKSAKTSRDPKLKALLKNKAEELIEKAAGAGEIRALCRQGEIFENRSLIARSNGGSRSEEMEIQKAIDCYLLAFEIKDNRFLTEIPMEDIHIARHHAAYELSRLYLKKNKYFLSVKYCILAALMSSSLCRIEGLSENVSAEDKFPQEKARATLYAAFAEALNLDAASWLAFAWKRLCRFVLQIFGEVKNTSFEIQTLRDEALKKSEDSSASCRRLSELGWGDTSLSSRCVRAFLLAMCHERYKDIESALLNPCGIKSSKSQADEQRITKVKEFCKPYVEIINEFYTHRANLTCKKS